MTAQAKVAVVTGGSRGTGRGIAIALGSHGCTVYVTGHSAKSGDHRLPGTIYETAEAVTAAGGTGTHSAFWDDALDEHGPKVANAHDYSEQQNAGHAKFFASTSHNLCNHTCEIDGDVAHCETYVVGSMLLKNLKGTILLIGRYIDRLEKRDGEWRIALRRTTVDTSLSGDASFLQTPMVTGFPKSVWTRGDPSYQRPLDLAAAVERW